MQSNSTSSIRQITSLKDLQVKLSKSKIYQTLPLPPKGPGKASGIFQLVLSKSLISNSIIKTKQTDFYQYRLLYYFLLYLAYEVPKVQQNFIFINSLVKFIRIDDNEKLSIVPGLENYGFLRKKQVLQSIDECLNKIQNQLGKQAIANVINSDKSKKFDLSFITAIHHLACNQGSLEFLLVKLGAYKALINSTSIEINEHIMKFSRKADYIEFRIEQNNFEAHANTLESIQLNSQLNSLSFAISDSQKPSVQPTYQQSPLNFDEIKKQGLLQHPPRFEMNQVFDSLGQLEISYPLPLYNINQSQGFRKQISVLLSMEQSKPTYQTPNRPLNLDIHQNQQKKKENFFQISTDSKDIQQNEQQSIFGETFQKNNKLTFVKVINQIYIPFDFQKRIINQHKNSDSLDKRSHKKSKSGATETNRSKTHSMDQKRSSITTNQDVKKSELFQMRQLINFNAESYANEQIKARRVQGRGYLQSFKKQGIKQRNTDDAAQCRRKLLQQYLKRTNQQL